MVVPPVEREMSVRARWRPFYTSTFRAIPPSCMNTEYMDGGGGRKAANHIFNAARPGGLTCGKVAGGVVASAVLGESGFQYDDKKLLFVGSLFSTSHYLFLTRREAGFSTLDKLRQASGLRLGAQSVGHTVYNVGRMMAWLLGLKEIRDVTGF